MMEFILVLAGSDSFGGAGIHADIKTTATLGAHAFAAVTAITAQNSMSVEAVHIPPPGFITRQAEAVISDQRPHAVKIGMLGSPGVVSEVARLIRKHELELVVIDPVCRTTTGHVLLDAEAVEEMKKSLLPLATVVTPNMDEAGVISGLKVNDVGAMTEAARIIRGIGPDVVVTGGHLKGDECRDIFYDGREFYTFQGFRIKPEHTHGSGCIFSSALAVYLARGLEKREAVKSAHEFARHAIMSGYECGKGRGPASPMIRG